VLGMSEVEFRAALLRHEEIRKEADRLGPIRYELRQRRAKNGPSVGQRVRAQTARQFCVVRAFGASLLRAWGLAERQSAQ
jgi:hypothetical protein